MPGTFHSYLSSRSQRRSASFVASERAPAASTNHDRTDVDSTVYLQDPNGPSWHVHMRQKLCRDKRRDDIPGWFDRWDVFLGVFDLADSIFSVSSDVDQAALRRVLWLRVVVHSALITALFAIAVYVPSVASLVRELLPTAWHRVALYAVLMLEVVLLKLALDMPWLVRWLVLAVYSVTLAALLASLQLASAQASMFYCCALALLPQVVVLLLCGVQRLTSDGSAVFLGHVSVGCVAALLTTVVAVTLHYSFEHPLFEDGDHLALAVFGLVAVAFVSAYEATLLFRTLAPDETWLGVYCVQLDLHVATLVIPSILLAMVAGGLLGLAIGTPIELLRQAYSNAWDFYSGGSTFGLIWHFGSRRPRRSARVGIAMNAPASQEAEDPVTSSQD